MQSAWRWPTAQTAQPWPITQFFYLIIFPYSFSTYFYFKKYFNKHINFIKTWWTILRLEIHILKAFKNYILHEHILKHEDLIFLILLIKIYKHFTKYYFYYIYMNTFQNNTNKIKCISITIITWIFIVITII